jgi:hypothetical protein
MTERKRMFALFDASVVIEVSFDVSLFRLACRGEDQKDYSALRNNVLSRQRGKLIIVSPFHRAATFSARSGSIKFICLTFNYIVSCATIAARSKQFNTFSHSEISRRIVLAPNVNWRTTRRKHEF